MTNRQIRVGINSLRDETKSERMLWMGGLPYGVSEVRDSDTSRNRNRQDRGHTEAMAAPRQGLHQGKAHFKARHKLSRG